MDALDKLFQDKFKDFTQNPLPGAFDKINAQLPQATIGTSASSGSWKGLLSSKAAVIKIAVAVTAITAITYAVVKLNPKETPKNTPELPQQNNIPVLPLDSVSNTTEINSLDRQEKKEKQKDNTLNAIQTTVIDTLTAVAPELKDTAFTPQEEPKSKKIKRKKKYEEFYKKGADDADSTIKLFK